MIIHLPTITLIPFSLPSRFALVAPAATKVQNMQNFQIIDNSKLYNFKKNNAEAPYTK